MMRRMDKAWKQARSKYQEKPKKNFYPFGHAKGALFVANEAFRSGWDAIFAKGGDHGKESQEEQKEVQGLLEGEAAPERAAEPST